MFLFLFLFRHRGPRAHVRASRRRIDKSQNRPGEKVMLVHSVPTQHSFSGAPAFTSIDIVGGTHFAGSAWHFWSGEGCVSIEDALAVCSACDAGAPRTADGSPPAPPIWRKAFENPNTSRSWRLRRLRVSGLRGEKSGAGAERS